MAFTYSIHGLTIASELECPGLPALPAAACDAFVRLGPVPSPSGPLQLGRMFYEAVPGSFTLEFARLARYRIRDGSGIVIDPRDGAAPDMVRRVLFGMAFAMLLYQRGLLPLHGSAVALPRGAAVFAGLSGHGKSTLVAALHQRGHTVLGDDLCAVADVASRPLLQPGYPRILLTPDAIERLGLSEQELEGSPPLHGKRQLRLSRPGVVPPVPLAAVYILEPAEGGEIELRPLRGIESLRALTEQSYKADLTVGMLPAGKHFRDVGSLAGKIRVVRLDRPARGFRIEELADRVEADLIANGLA